MKPRNFAALGGGSAAAVNAGTIGIQKDKVVYLDPTSEILYDPEENIRNGKVVDEGIEGLIDLRIAMDQAEQLQPIRVYPLPQDKLDPKRPSLKYGVGYGHRRTLSCRLTNKDDPRIGDKPRKVAAVIDVGWLSRGRSYRLRCQIQENTHRVELNPVELGQALQSFQGELSKEEGRHVSQRELQGAFGLREKTVYNLLKAAEFHEIAKDVCHRQLLSDLDTMVTFDAICKLNEDLAQAICNSLAVEGAPSNRSLIRQAKAMAEVPDYIFDAEGWSWPDSIQPDGVKSRADASGVNSQAVPADTSGIHGEQQLSMPGLQGEAATNPDTLLESATQPAPGYTETPSDTTEPQSTQASTQPDASVKSAQANTQTPILMVTFKANGKKKSLTGELLLGVKAKNPNLGVVAYLNEGKEEQIEVPLKDIVLLSINHT